MIERLIGTLLFGALPVMAAGYSIYLPFRRYRESKREAQLTVGILNAVFGGLSIVSIVLMFTLKSVYPTFGPQLLILICLMAALLVGRRPRAAAPKSN